jgi:hypothetical protein
MKSICICHEIQTTQPQRINTDYEQGNEGKVPEIGANRLTFNNKENILFSTFFIG